MAQIKIYGLKVTINGRQGEISNAIHEVLMAELHLPPEKRFHRFLGLEREDFFYPSDRSDDYLIVEISLFEGRAIETKKALIRALFQSLGSIGFEAQVVEITIFETPRHNWGIRGKCGDEIGLSYIVEV